MKRHPSLKKLSDDHHGGLVQARRLRRAGAGEGETPSEAARAFLRFWDEDTRIRFREEEEMLLAVYARHGGDLRTEPIQEMVADHARIRGLVMTLIEEDRSSEVGLATLSKIGERLEAHIRLEERRVFPLVEAALLEGEPGALLVRLAGSRGAYQSADVQRVFLGSGALLELVVLPLGREPLRCHPRAPEHNGHGLYPAFRT